MANVLFHRVVSLPAILEPGAFYFVGAAPYAEAYLTDSAGEAHPIGNTTMIQALLASGSFSWDQLTESPLSTVAQLDDAVAQRHYHTNGEVLNQLSEGAAGLMYAGHPVRSLTGQIGANFNSSGSPLTVGSAAEIVLPYTMTLSEATLLASPMGSLTIDVRAGTYADFPLTNVHSIVGSTPPQLASAVKMQDTALAGWTKTLAQGTIIQFVVTDCTAITKASLSLKGVKS